MQSGRANTQFWELVFEPAAALIVDPLMGWTQSTDTNGQVRLRFASQEEAVDYARRHGIPFEVAPETKTKRIIKSYADNFAYQRRQPWTH
jgi:hypothetical protein